MNQIEKNNTDYKNDTNKNMNTSIQDKLIKNFLNMFNCTYLCHTNELPEYATIGYSSEFNELYYRFKIEQKISSVNYPIYIDISCYFTYQKLVINYTNSYTKSQLDMGEIVSSPYEYVQLINEKLIYIHILYPDQEILQILKNPPKNIPIVNNNQNKNNSSSSSSLTNFIRLNNNKPLTII